MKQTYKTNVTITIYLKTGKILYADSDCSHHRYKIRYNTLPPSKSSEIFPEELEVMRYRLKEQYYPVIINFGRHKNRDYIEVLLTTGLRKIYYNEIYMLYIEETYEAIDIDSVPIETLEHDLGFRGYSELWFDRWEELKEKQDFRIISYNICSS